MSTVSTNYKDLIELEAKRGQLLSSAFLSEMQKLYENAFVLQDKPEGKTLEDVVNQEVSKLKNL